MLFKLFIFVIFLCPLVFFHELGHYLFARLCGVRVEVFSIGFGPKIYKWKRKGTEFALSLIPLGGYVKMFGDDPMKSEEIPEEQRKESFVFKSKMARFWIVFGGPLANVIFAFVLFFFLLLVGEQAPEIRFGVINPTSQFYEVGVRTGDYLKTINGNAIHSLSDIALEASGDVKTITIDRDNVDKKIALNWKGKKFIDLFTEHPPFLRSPLVVNGKGDIHSIFSKSNHERVSLDRLAYFNSNEFVIAKGEQDLLIEKDWVEQFSLPVGNLQGFIAALIDKGYYPLDLVVKSIKRNSAADSAGLLAGDVVVKLNDLNLYSFDQLRTQLQKVEEKDVTIEVIRNGKRQTLNMTPQIVIEENHSQKLIGVYTSAQYEKPKFVKLPGKGPIDSFTGAFTKTFKSIGGIFMGFVQLLTNKDSIKNVGGPIAIGKIAADSFELSLTYFFHLMALISINLGIINLFPIPVLDGGHIMFLFMELVNGGPVSRRKMEIAQQVGLSILLILMFAALYNDFSRLF